MGSIPEFSGLRVLITGASGFVGFALAERLIREGAEVWALIHDVDPSIMSGLRRERLIRGSLTDLQACERAIVTSQANVVFHLGAQAIVPHARRDPHATLEANVRGTYNVLEAWRRNKETRSVFIMASSDKAYGDLIVPGAIQPTEYGEAHPLEGRGPYDVSKSCADLIAQSYALEYGLSIGIIRAGNIYGPGDFDLTRIVPSVARSLAKGEPPVLMSDGSPVRDYLYIDDAVEAYLSVMRHISGLSGTMNRSAQAFNFSGGEPISALKLAELAIEEARLDRPVSPIVTGMRTGEIQLQVLSTEKARKVLGWKPTVCLREGIRRTIHWWWSESNGPVVAPIQKGFE